MKEMTNEEILAAPSPLLTGIDKQKKFCLQMGLIQAPCPNCKTPLNVFEAARIKINDYTFGNDECKYVCVNQDCARTLIHCVPLFGPGIWYWSLA